MKRPKLVSGLHANRLRDPLHRLERLFAERWQRENTLTSGRPRVLLDYLLNGEVSERDAVVAATVVQWLGSEIGQYFLEEVKNESETP